MIEPEIEHRPWSEQLRLDDEAYREQIGWLLARSRFYQAKLKVAGFAAPAAWVGLPASIACRSLKRMNCVQRAVPPSPSASTCACP